MKQLLTLFIGWVLIGCSPARQLAHDFHTKPTYTDHLIGVAVYDPLQRRALLQHNADIAFTPASNTKLFSFYAGLLSLHDSLPVLRYVARNDSLIFWGTGNPLLLHPDLPDTTALAFLRNRRERLFFSGVNYTGPRFGTGWAWDDYNDDYSPELASLPVYGNVVRFAKTVSPRRFSDSTLTTQTTSGVRRAEFSNQFVRATAESIKRQDVPFRWSARVAAQLLADTLHKPVGVVNLPVPATAHLLRGASTDSLYKRMLHVSDNQFAEQVLFMISAERSSGELNPLVELHRIADGLHYPATSARWVDGSGLSRYNLFTPNVFIDLLRLIYAKVPQQRLFSLLPAGPRMATSRSGTLRSLATGEVPYVFAKSGSMTGVYNLSGYVLTKQSKVLYFSIMHNNFTQPISEMRRRTVELLQKIYERF